MSVRPGEILLSRHLHYPAIGQPIRVRLREQLLLGIWHRPVTVERGCVIESASVLGSQCCGFLRKRGRLRRSGGSWSASISKVTHLCPQSLQQRRLRTDDPWSTGRVSMTRTLGLEQEGQTINSSVLWVVPRSTRLPLECQHGKGGVSTCIRHTTKMARLLESRDIERIQASA